MSITDKNKRKVEILKRFLSNKDKAAFDSVLELHDRIDEVIESIEDAFEDLPEKIKNAIYDDIDMEEMKGEDGEDGAPGKDGENYVLTEEDKKEIAAKIKVPVVEKIIEKITVEKPIVKNFYETKEVVVPEKQSIEDIRDALEQLDGDDRLPYTSIKGLEELFKKNGAKNVTLVAGTNGIFVYVNGKKKGIAKMLNFAAGSGIAISATPGTGYTTITFSTGNVVSEEVPTGSGTAFQLAHTPLAGTLKLYRGGARQFVTAGDYSISGQNITLAFALQSGEILLADYSY